MKNLTFQPSMKTLVIGLGSMGKRRIRCLKALGYNNIFGFDSSALTTDNVCQKYGIRTCWEREILLDWIHEQKFDLMLICVPPTTKQEFITLANSYKITCFCEAD